MSARAVRWSWLSLLALVVIRLAVGTRIDLQLARIRCVPATCVGPPQMTAHEARLLHTLGIPLDIYALYFAAVTFTLVAVSCAFAGVLLWKRPGDRMAVLTAFTLPLFSAFALGLPSQSFQQFAPIFWVPAALLGMIGSIGILLVFYLFPDGRPVPHWPMLLLGIYALAQIPQYLAPSLLDALNRDLGQVGQVIAALTTLLTYLSLICAQVYRYRRISTPTQREQTKWVVYGIGATITVFFVTLVMFNVSTQETPVSDMTLIAIGTLVWLILPISLSIAILRYHLWEIDVLINRTLVYGSLTVTLAAVYLGAVIGLQVLFRAITGQHSDLAIAIATLTVAALFNPWRHHLQGFIDRRFYRRKYDAQRILAAFNARLRDEVDLDQLTDDILGAVTETMQPARVSLWLAGDVPHA